MCANAEHEENEARRMVLVPYHPTKEMVKEAWEAALAEDAEWVWKEMIDVWLQSQGNSSSESG